MTKLPFWEDPNAHITILDATQEAQNQYGHRYGSDTVVLNREHIDALMSGKMLAWTDGEYSTFVIMTPDKEA